VRQFHGAFGIVDCNRERATPRDAGWSPVLFQIALQDGVEGLDDPGALSIHSHSIINRSRKPAWLKGFAMINMGHYRRFYRHPTRALVWCGRWRDLRGDDSGKSVVNRPLG